MFDTLLAHFSLFDLAAFGYFCVCALGYGWVTSRGWLATDSITTAIYEQRRRWMEQMARRDMRVPDLLIISNFNQVNGFFATTTVFILGGLAAVALAGDGGRSALQTLPFVRESTPLAWVLKIGVLVVLFVNAFFKFVWAHRLSQYLAITVGATPAPGEDDDEERARQVRLGALLANRASSHAYRGLYAYYFSLAALTWFIHPALLILSTTLVAGSLYRREFLSQSARAFRRSAPET